MEWFYLGINKDTHLYLGSTKGASCSLFFLPLFSLHIILEERWCYNAKSIRANHPLQLPCRYSDKCACYTKVYIITNIPFEDQYDTIQTTQRATWEAFRRRIHHFEEYKKVSDTEVKVIKTDAQEYYDKVDNIPPFK